MITRGTRPIVFSILATLIPVLSAIPQSAPPGIALTHVTLIDATGSPAKGDMTVIIRGDRIITIGRTSETALPSETVALDASGKFLIPGLWDMHVHALQSRMRESTFAMFIARGVLGVRDMGSSRQALEEFRRWRKTASGEAALAPRVVASGPLIDGSKPMFPDLSIAVRNEVEARQAVAAICESGADFIKAYSLLSRDAYFAIADELHSRGLALTGHVPDSVTAAEASDAGQKSIEHLSGVWLSCSSLEDKLRDELHKARSSGDPSLVCRALQAVNSEGVLTYDETKAQLLFQGFVRNRTWHVPTLVTTRAVMPMRDPTADCSDRAPSMRPVKTLPAKQGSEKEFLANAGLQRLFDLVRDMRQAGVEFMAGTDAPNPIAAPGVSLHTELEFLVRSGFSPMEALRSATAKPAEYLGMQAELGTIEAGKIADLVLLDADPLMSISNTRRVAGILLRGRLILKSELDQDVAEANSSEHDWMGGRDAIGAFNLDLRFERGFSDNSLFNGYPAALSLISRSRALRPLALAPWGAKE